MTLADGIIAGIIILILSLAGLKLYRDKKRGVTCTGCTGCPIEGKCDSELMKNK
jgi:hypothetical protein